MNVEIGAEAALFPEKEYINGIAFAVLEWLTDAIGTVGWVMTQPSTPVVIMTQLCHCH
jgi:hypothetical protein